MNSRTVLRRLFREQLTVAPGVFDALSANLAEAVGFDAVYVSGANVAAAALGLPDIGLLTLTEIVAVAENIVETVAIPVICDADTGYGNAVNVARTVRRLERAGVAAIQIEDQVFPKRCGHFDQKRVISTAEMVQKLRAAQDARHDPDLLIIARTDACAVLGMTEAIRRAQQYAAAGADMIFVEAPPSREHLRDIARQVNAPLMANMVEGGKTPLLSAAELDALGYRLVIWPATAMRGALRGMRLALETLKEQGTTEGYLTHLATWDERMAAVRMPLYAELERRYQVHEQ